MKLSKVSLKTRLLLIAIFSFSLMGSFKVQAANVLNPVCNNPEATSQPTVCKGAQSTGNPLLGPDGVLTKAVNIIALVVGVTAVFVIIIAGLRFITSGGDSAKASSARQAVIYALVGLVVAVLSKTIVTFVLDKI